jgi:intergrase/recombinase
MEGNRDLGKQRVLVIISLRNSRRLGVSPTADPPGFEPGTTGSEGGKKIVERRKIALVANLRQYATEGNVEAFYDYLINERKISEKTAKQYVSAISKPFHETRNAQKTYRLFCEILSFTWSNK